MRFIVFASLCIMQVIGQVDPFSCFVLFTNRYIAHGGSRVIRHAPSAEFCLQQCLDAEHYYGFSCKTVMWKRNTNDCIMGKWTVDERISHIKHDLRQEVDLYENICQTKEIENSLPFYKTGEITYRTTISPEVIQSTPISEVSSGKKWKKPRREFRRSRSKSLHGSKSISIGYSTAEFQVDRSVEERPVRTVGRAHVNGVVPFSKSPSLPAPTLPPKIVLSDDTQFSARLDGNPWYRLVKKAIRPGPVTKHWLPSSRVTSPTPPSAPPTMFSTMILKSHENAVTVLSKRTTLAMANGQHSTTTPVPSTRKTTLSTGQDAMEFMPTTTRRPPCFRRLKGQALLEFEEKRINAPNITACLSACLRVTSFYCASTNYDQNSGLCIMNGGNLHISNAQLVASRQFDYFENTCHPGESDEIEEEERFDPTSSIAKCFKVTKNSALISLDAIVIRHLSSLESCLQECVNGRTPCTSLNWVPHNKGCMLFHGSIDRSQLSPSSLTSFYENTNCLEMIKSNTTTGDDYYDQS